MKIAYLGPAGTQTERAARRITKGRGSLIACKSISRVFDMVESGEANAGIVPIENSAEGGVNATLDGLLERQIKIIQEIEMPIHHSLLTSKNTSKKEIRTIISHQQALHQCAKFLEKNFPNAELEEAASSAAAAREALVRDGVAAIAHASLSGKLGLQIVAKNIEDDSENWTRFIAIARKGNAKGNKTSVIFSVKHRPGALHHALGALAAHRANMTKIESRPYPGRRWEYVFFVDLEGSEKELAGTLDDLEKLCMSLKRLGSYPTTKYKA